MKAIKNLKEGQKVLIQYLRKRNSNPGVVVAIGPDIIGWSLCNKKDRYSKEMAFHLALGRAEKAAKLDPAEREYYYYERIPTTLLDIATKVRNRSEQYFK